MNDDDELHSRLQRWEIDLPVDPRFRAAVWRKIATRDSFSWLDFLRGWLEDASTPRRAIPLAVIAAIAVALIASMHGLHRRERTWEELASTYTSAIDPVIQMERNASREPLN